MDEQDETPESGQILHDLRQPLNVIRLTGGNIRSRIVPQLDEASAAYLVAKLDRIEEQTQRAAQLIEQLLAHRMSR